MSENCTHGRAKSLKDLLFTRQYCKFISDDTDLFTAEREAAHIEDQTTTLVFNPNRSLNLSAQRQKLPIQRYKNEILFCLENFQTLVIVGECGSGK